jgi:G3E family GTPase
MIPVLVLTGFLGSGKTTLLRHLLRQPEFSRTAVIINEFGEVGIDHDLVEASTDSFIELATGCLCCKVRSDLVETLADMLHRRDRGTVPPFTRVVIETSGLADPAPILHTLMTDTTVAGRLMLGGVVTTVDAVNGAGTLRREEISVKQVALADRIVLTKTDLAGTDWGPVRDRLAELNAAAPVAIAQHGRIEPRVLEASAFDPRIKFLDINSWLQAAAKKECSPDEPPGRREAPPDDKLREIRVLPPPRHVAPLMRATAHGSKRSREHLHARHDPKIQTYAIVRQEPIHAVTLTLFLETLAEHCGADLLRLKGIVNVVESPQQPAVIHGVQHVFHPPAWLAHWPSDDRRSRIVMITRSIAQRWPELLLDALDAEVAAVCAGR